MDSISRYRLGRHEDGSWHVIDGKTGGLAEVSFEGQFFLLWKLPQNEAEAWSTILDARDRRRSGE